MAKDARLRPKIKAPLSYDAVLMRSSEGVSVVKSISDVVGLRKHDESTDHFRTTTVPAAPCVRNV